MTNELTPQPQAEQMADESMVRGLAAQAIAIWPQERLLFERYSVPSNGRILDLACGTGEITERLAELFTDAELVGIDLIEEHLELARERCQSDAARIDFRVGDAFKLDLEANSIDLSVCRHLLQAIPDPTLILKELARVTRAGGTVHVLAEDYAMMHFHPVTVDTDDFWRRGPMVFAERTGTDLRSGRKLFTLMSELGWSDVKVDYVVVDTTRVPREVFADIWIAWRDGYADAIGAHTEVTAEEARAAFQTMIDAIQNPAGYGVWQVPIISGKPQ